jgi:hypothetical protein
MGSSKFKNLENLIQPNLKPTSPIYTGDIPSYPVTSLVLMWTTSRYGNQFYYFFFRLVGMTPATIASVGPMIRPAHMNRVATPKMT